MFAADDDEFEEELFEDEDLNMLFAAVGPFTRRQLNRVKGYFEVTVPTYAPYEFQLAGNVAIKCLGFEQTDLLGYFVKGNKSINRTLTCISCQTFVV